MMKFKESHIASLFSLALCAFSCADAIGQATWRAETSVNAGSGHFAPYYISSNVHGVVNSPISAYERGSIVSALDLSQRFSWGFGADFLAGGGKGIDYEKYHAEAERWARNSMHSPYAWVQQLYAEAKYRGVFLTLGMKEYGSPMLNSRLSSGDITYSGNTRPMPGFRAGFVDYQDVPFTMGWVQIRGEIGYAKMLDDGWAKDHFNFFNGHYTDGQWYTYKYCYFRSNPSKPLSVTFGMQAAGQFCGNTYKYSGGDCYDVVKHPLSLSYFFKMFIPRYGEDYVPGSHNGSWDIKARYRLRSGHELMAYYQSPWEDGSGVGKLNGFDGLWGIEYRSPDSGAPLSGAVIEYIDFTNQSGPLHWDPVDTPGTSITTQATGKDNYYNNNITNGYAYYGRSIGSPMIISPFYNLLGQNDFICTRMRGVHMAAEGNISPALAWRAMWSWRKGWGTYPQPFLSPRTDTSMMIECAWRVPSIPALRVKGQLAFDAGSLYGDNFGALLSVSYSGNISFRKK